jgi:hypothetical protein
MGADLSQYTAMTREEMRDHIYLAVKLSYGVLPQMKGKGAVRDLDARERALKLFAERITDQILLGNALLLRGPPAKRHSCPVAARHTKRRTSGKRRV